ncbi:MAG: hypothetical protein N2491_03120 [Negativicutes bacterium]|nr:hypothetical protein [Negativicutes bacterium]
MQSNKGNRDFVKLLLIALVFVLAAGAGLWYFHSGWGSALLQRWLAQPAKQNPSIVAEAGDQSKSIQDLTNPEIYLPKPNTMFKVYQRHFDGDQGFSDYYTAKLAGAALVSETEIAASSEGKTGFTLHYLSAPDGIYYAYDTNVELKALWLKKALSVGMSWEQYGIKSTVRKMGAVCNLGIGVFKDCLVIEEVNAPVGRRVEKYFAPGHGQILIKDLANGQIVFELRGINQLDAKKAEETVKKFAPNADRLKSIM